MTSPQFAGAAAGTGLYESFYLRAVDPERPRSVWIRYTVHHPPDAATTGSLWCTVFDAERAEPYAVKQTIADPIVPPGGWIAIGESTFTDTEVRGQAAGANRSAAWQLSVASAAPALRHLPKEWMYRASLPRTKLESPHPAARFSGTVQVGEEDVIALDGWPGMVGHNWGAEHAATWIWLHGTLFDGAPDAWLDLAVGRVRVGPVLTPWIANGALGSRGQVTRLGGMRPAKVEATPQGCRVAVAGATIEARSPAGQTVAWLYGDPRGGEHHSLNCSIAELRVEHRAPGGASPLHTAHGGVYELGTTDTAHGVALQPFADG